MKAYFARRVLVFCGCFIYLNACQAPLTSASERWNDEKPYHELEATWGGGEKNYEIITVAVQDEHRGEVPQDENSDFFDP